MRAAISTLQYYTDLPRLPGTFSVPDARNSDILDLLQCVFGFQVSIFVCIFLINFICLFQVDITTVIVSQRNRHML